MSQWNMRKIVPLGLLALISLSVAALTFAQSGGGQKSQKEAQGFYTKAQVQKGQHLYDQYCAVCHGVNLQGGAGPALAGKGFMSHATFSNLTANDLFQIMSTKMPKTDPGSLKQDQYVAILAYVLQQNGYAAGQMPLTAKADALKQIKIEPQTDSAPGQKGGGSGE